MLTFLAAFLRPFLLLLVLGLICLPVRLAVKRWMPDGKLKRLLLSPVTAEEPKRGLRHPK
jgi:hypothetical protein